MNLFHICMHMYMYVYIWIRLHLHVYMYMPMSVYVHSTSLYVYVYVCMYVCMYVCTHAYIHTHIHVRTLSHTRIQRPIMLATCDFNDNMPVREWNVPRCTCRDIRRVCTHCILIVCSSHNPHSRPYIHTYIYM